MTRPRKKAVLEDGEHNNEIEIDGLYMSPEIQAAQDGSAVSMEVRVDSQLGQTTTYREKSPK
jgi:hypothetical protein